MSASSDEKRRQKKELRAYQRSFILDLLRRDLAVTIYDRNF